jgi:hypothetical protein
MDMLDVLARHGDGDLAELGSSRHQYPGWFLTSSNRASVASRFAVEQREQRIQHLRLARLIALPPRRRLLAHHAVDLEGQLTSRFHSLRVGSATAAGAAPAARIRGRLL